MKTAWQQREEAKKSLCPNPDNVIFCMAVKKAGKNLEKDRKAAVLNFYANFILTMCVAFGLTFIEAKTEIMCLRTNGVPDAPATFGVEAAGKVYNKQMFSVHSQRLEKLPEEHHRTVRSTECPSMFEIRILKAEGLETML